MSSRPMAKESRKREDKPKKKKSREDERRKKSKEESKIVRSRDSVRSLKNPVEGESKKVSKTRTPTSANKSRVSNEAPKRRTNSNPREEENKNKATWAENANKLECRAISKEFNDKIKRYIPPNSTAEICAKFDEKNRYNDVLCLDATRVVLKGKKEGDDYIHANWITIPDGAKYICTQGPLADTIEDFWHMCMTEKASIILMLCNFFEGGDNEKCAVYFPTGKDKDGNGSDTQEFGAFTVTKVKNLDHLSSVDGITITALEVTKKGEEKVYKVKHVLMTSWPDQLAPLEAAPVLSLWRWVKKYNKDKPVVVHCSAGVGRTSTFVGFELANHLISGDPTLNLMEVIKILRSMRYQSIQSHVQFLYLHVLLMEYFVQEGIFKKPEEGGFIAEYKKHALKKLAKMKNAAKKDKEKEKDDKQADVSVKGRKLEALVNDAV